MKTFFEYFKTRKGEETPGDSESGSANPPFAPQPQTNEPPATKLESSATARNPGKNIALSAQPVSSGGKGPDVQTIFLELGDFLKRIPPEFLRPGDHEPTRELRFTIEEVTNNITHGKATIPLKEIVKRCPEIFKDSVAGKNNVEIYFPWQKLARQVDILRDHNSRAQIEAKKKEANAQTWYSKSGGEPVSANAQPTKETPVGSAVNRRADETMEPYPDQNSGLERTKGSGAIGQAEIPTERGTGTGESAQPGGHQAKLIAVLKADRDNTFKALEEARAEIVRTRDESRIKISKLTSERDALKRERSQSVSQMEQLRADHKKQIDFINGDTEKKVAALKQRIDAAAAEREKLAEDLKNQREKFNTEIEGLRIALAKARDEAGA